MKSKKKHESQLCQFALTATNVLHVYPSESKTNKTTEIAKAEDTQVVIVSECASEESSIIQQKVGYPQQEAEIIYSESQDTSNKIPYTEGVVVCQDLTQPADTSNASKITFSYVPVNIESEQKVSFLQPTEEKSVLAFAAQEAGISEADDDYQTNTQSYVNEKQRSEQFALQ